MALAAKETTTIIREVEEGKVVEVSLNITKFQVFQIELRVKMMATLEITLP